MKADDTHSTWDIREILAEQGVVTFFGYSIRDLPRTYRDVLSNVVVNALNEARDRNTVRITWDELNALSAAEALHNIAPGAREGSPR